jgi:hypothetical protein
MPTTLAFVTVLATVAHATSVLTTLQVQPVLSEDLTISIINSRYVPISTSHTLSASASTPIRGNIRSGTIALTWTTVFAIPTGWAANIAIVDMPFPLEGRSSLIEGSFISPNKIQNLEVACQAGS